MFTFNLVVADLHVTYQRAQDNFQQTTWLTDV